VLGGRRLGPEALLERRLKVVLEAPLESSVEVPLKLEAWNQIEMEGLLERGAVAFQN
jgi:hypothetical protein